MNKIVTFALLSLVTSMIVSGIPSQIYAESELDVLVRITTQARDHIKFELSNIDELPDEIRELYQQGSDNTDALIAAAEQEDIESTKEHFLAAMQIFKEIGQRINEKRDVAKIALAQSTDVSHGIKPVIDRMERYVDRLEKIAERNNVDVDFNTLHELVESAKISYNDGNLDDAKKSLEILEPLTLDVFNTLKNDSEQKKVLRAQEFAQKHVQQINVLIVQARDLGLSENITNYLEQSKLNLTEASDSKQIAKQSKIALALQNQVKKEESSRIDAIINQLDTKINQLSTTDNVNVTSLNKAKTMLNELKILVADGNLRDGFQVYRDLSNLLKDIENPRNDKSEKTDTTDSLSDSKTSRIEIKIQQLGNELLKLREKTENIPAAKYWIDNGISLLRQAQSNVDDSPDDALKKISQVERIIKNIYKLLE